MRTVYSEVRFLHFPVLDLLAVEARVWLFFGNKIWLDSCVLWLKIEAWQERENFTGPCCPAVLAASAIKCGGLIQHGWAGDIFENNSPQLIWSVQANTCSWQKVQNEGKNLEKTGWRRSSQAVKVQHIYRIYTVYIYLYYIYISMYALACML